MPCRVQQLAACACAQSCRWWFREGGALRATPGPRGPFRQGREVGTSPVRRTPLPKLLSEWGCRDHPCIPTAPSGGPVSPRSQRSVSHTSCCTPHRAETPPCLACHRLPLLRGGRLPVCLGQLQSSRRVLNHVLPTSSCAHATPCSFARRQVRCLPGVSLPRGIGVWEGSLSGLPATYRHIRHVCIHVRTDTAVAQDVRDP